jgi:hypothetical protein
MTGRVGRHLLDRELLVALLVLVEDRQLEALSRVLEVARRALALLEDRLDGGRRRDHHLDRRAEQHAQLVDHRQIGRVADHDHQRVAVAPVRHEPVAQHQFRGNRPEQIVVDVEMRQVEERQPVPIGQVLRLGDLRRRFRGALLGRAAVDVELRVLRGCNGNDVFVHQLLTWSFA